MRGESQTFSKFVFVGVQSCGNYFGTYKEDDLRQVQINLLFPTMQSSFQLSPTTFIQQLFGILCNPRQLRSNANDSFGTRLDWWCELAGVSLSMLSHITRILPQAVKLAFIQDKTKKQKAATVARRISIGRYGELRTESYKYP